MKAIVKTASGPGNVTLKEMPTPRLKTGQVLIEVNTAGVCGSDLHILHDDIKLKLAPPVIMGHEFSGVIEKIAPDVNGWQVGDRVVAETTFKACGRCGPCLNDSYNLCREKELLGYVHNGCFTRYVAVPANRLHKIPDSVTMEEAALMEPLACCVHAVAERSGIKSGDNVLIAGVGAIGLLSAQVAASLGARVVLCGTSSDKARFDIARKLGFRAFIDVEREAPAKVFAEWSNSEELDVFLECSGVPAAARMGIAMLRRGGNYCQIGLFGKPLEFELEQLAYKEITATGSIGSKYSSWKTALGLLMSRKVNVRPFIGKPLPLEKWETAFSNFENKVGIKVLLKPS